MSEALTTLEIPELRTFKSGKVREVFDLGETLLLVATDRISAFDCILPDGIPQKGSVLNQISAFWFERTEDIVPNHMISIDTTDLPSALNAYKSTLAGRSMITRKADALPVECVVRGYIIGSGWKEYQASQSICGIPLREGYQMAEKLDEALFTPSTKAEEGHDENITFEQTVELIGSELAEQVRDVSLALYTQAAAYAAERGIIIADTKFEFGMIDGQLTLIDEALTPDSSRFWPQSEYKPGMSPPSFDKQYVRDYLDSLDWDKTPPAPALPPEVAQRSGEKYLEAFRLLTGRELA